MKSIIFFTALCTIMSCAMGSDGDGMTFGLPDTLSGRKITLEFKRGKDFSHTKMFAFAKVTIRPQMAVWVEDTTGRYLQTVFVTRCFGKQQWRFIKPNPDSCFRSMCMPYWLNRYKAAGNAAPTSAHPLPDGVTGATPTGSFTINFALPETLSTVVVAAEWNSSFDNNATFTEKATSFNGQPSVVARARIVLDDSVKPVDTLVIAGYGGTTADDPGLHPDIEKLTTAKSIFDLITATVRP